MIKTDRSASARNRNRPVPRTGPSSAAVREWAAAQGIAVSPRGRISADVGAQYEAPNPGDADLSRWLGVRFLVIYQVGLIRGEWLRWSAVPAAPR